MSTQRAFVIQFGKETLGTPTLFQGRVEHVGSGEATHFTSPDELLEFLLELVGQPSLAIRSESAPDAAAVPAARPRRRTAQP